MFSLYKFNTFKCACSVKIKNRFDLSPEAVINIILWDDIGLLNLKTVFISSCFNNAWQVVHVAFSFNDIT